jgi:hypothetical protein
MMTKNTLCKIALFAVSGSPKSKCSCTRLIWDARTAVV